MSTLMTVDLTAVLDTSTVGAEAAKLLERLWAEARTQPEDKRRELLKQLEARRDGLRQQLLDRARPIIAELARQKGATMVVEKSAVLFSSGEDLTQALIARVDAAGPLKA
jgi:Skp family chaperone for outer membrane proteins